MKYPMSMTAFGRGECTAGPRTWTAEVRSVNHRYCDIKIKLPRKYAGLEERIKKEIMASYSRGHIDVIVSYTGETAEALSLQTNLQLAREYLNCLKTLQDELALDETPNLTMVKDFKDVITAVEEEEDLDAVWPPIREALAAALEGCQNMRAAEGAELKRDMLQRLETFSAVIDSISSSIPDLLQKKQLKLKERLDNLLNGVDIDPIRLAQEVAILADKSDVTEEVVRLQSHIKQFADFLELEEPVGRRLDFLLQEFLREVNTLASKISDAPIAHQTVDLKNEIEKLREQTQNIE